MSTRRLPQHARFVMARGAGGSDGGDMDDVLRRAGVVESLVAEAREDVSAISLRASRDKRGILFFAVACNGNRSDEL
jgi:hypothetical protein